MGDHWWWGRWSGRSRRRCATHPSYSATPHFSHQTPFVVTVVLPTIEEESVAGIAVVGAAGELLGLRSCTGNMLCQLVYQGAVVGV